MASVLDVVGPRRARTGLGRFIMVEITGAIASATRRSQSSSCRVTGGGWASLESRPPSIDLDENQIENVGLCEERRRRVRLVLKGVE